MLKRVLGVALAASVLLPAAAMSAAPFPVTVTDDAGKVTIAKKPTRIVSLSPTATEMLFAVGAGKQVIAVDDQSNYPAVAPTTKLSGFKPNIEAIAKFRPDLVVLANDQDKIVAKLRKLKIPVLQNGAALGLKGTYTQIAQIGRATGNGARANRLVAKLRTRMATIVASVKGIPSGKTYYHELDPTFYSVTSKTFIGTVYAKLGLKNIADGGAVTDYPQLSGEAIVAANPDFIFLADVQCCAQTAAIVAARPGFSGISAVKSGNVVELPADIPSRWGPRVVDFAALVAKRLKAGSPGQ